MGYLCNLFGLVELNYLYLTLFCSAAVMLYLIDTGKDYLESVSDKIISVVEASPS